VLMTVRSVKSCSLDYVKTSNSTNAVPSRLKQTLDSQTIKATSLDLSFLVESVVEGIHTGHNYRTSTFRSLDGEKLSNGQLSTTLASPTGEVIIILDIDWQASWVFASQSGNWKRILMNLFGNALKYTQSGFVLVSLSCKTIRASSTSPAHNVVTLQIDDSGKGMSKDYLKYQLFTPFTQEDQLAPGTGLGLSIVRQLVTDLGGKIDIQSEVGYGTTVKVSVRLDLPPPLSDSTSLENSRLISDTRRRCEGLTLCLVGFEYYPDLEENPTGILSPHARRMLALKSSLQNIAGNWFGMKVSIASSLASADGDIFVGLRSRMALLDGHMQKQALVVFEDTTGSGRCRDAKGIISLSQP
jgi:hypothetical protein